MMRFIDLGKQIAVDESDENYPRQFAFYDTITDNFLRYNGFSVFDNWTDFVEQFRLDSSDINLLNRLRSLCPEWVFG